MLVNLTPKSDFRTQRSKQRNFWRRHMRDWDTYTKQEWFSFERFFKPTQYTGVYDSDFDGEMINSWTKQVAYYSHGFWRKHRDAYNPNKHYWEFGVADNIEQVIEMYNKNVDGIFSGNHVISYREVRRSDRSGWRWHKWGPYIGTRHPQREYLEDEPEIDKVICFSIYKVR